VKPIIPLLVSALIVVGVFGATAGAVDSQVQDGLAWAIGLPQGWLPEGIVSDGNVIYAGSRRHGAIYAHDLTSGVGRVLVPPQQGRIAVGLAFDPRTGYIFVAGGGGGAGYVYDSATGASVASFTFGATPTFVNDVIVTPTAAYFTDSNQPFLYRVPLGLGGELPAAGAVQRLNLGGDYRHETGFNLNGIEATPAGDALIVVQSNTGRLFRVDPATGVARGINLRGYSVANGDGILLDGLTLYVVRNQNNLIAEFHLTPDLSLGTLAAEHTSPDFDTPTTATRAGHGFYAVNARFAAGNSPNNTYGIVRFR
jgi:sugar lactone lactonase YvrE